MQNRSTSISSSVKRSEDGSEVIPIEEVEEKTFLEKRLTQAFKLLAARNEKLLQSDLGTVIRSLGCVVSEAELQTIQSKIVDPDCGCVHLDEFLQHMTIEVDQQKYQPAAAKDLLSAFQLLDVANRGYVSEDDFKKALTESGEPLSEKEVKEIMIYTKKPGSNKIYYEDYIRLLIPKIIEEENVYALHAKDLKVQMEKALTKVSFMERMMINLQD